MTVKRTDNVGIVVANLDAAIAFFTELGLALEGRMPVEGEWAGSDHRTAPVNSLGYLLGLAQEPGGAA